MIVPGKEGYTAMVYFQTIPQTVVVGKDTYSFFVKRNICLAWVKDEHVNTVLSITKSCCGGNKTHPYRIANDHLIRVWEGIAER